MLAPNSRCVLQRVELRVAALVVALAMPACSRDLPPSLQDEACAAICQSVLCSTPDLDSDGVARCESYCHGKFEESVRQSDACQEALAEAMSCLMELSCDQFASWYFSEPDDPCPTARAVVEDACEGLYLEPEILPP
jgi:hypothetical protein